jgi:hypothetical protein
MRLSLKSVEKLIKSKFKLQDEYFKSKILLKSQLFYSIYGKV